MAEGRSQWTWFYLYATVVIVSFTSLSSAASAYTDPLDVRALQDMFKALNKPSQLKGWKLEDGDPCEESWTGVLCSGPFVIYLKLSGLNLSGSLGTQIHNLHALKHMDVSSNNIQGVIPHEFPPNLTHLNLAYNNLGQNLPYSLASMKNLRHLNMSHNSLSGPLGNVFTDLYNLKEMDLSLNQFTGDLPSSFESLKNLTRLFLQNNKLTGSVVFLANLPLTDLNIQGNHFSGIIPNHFQTIPNLWIGGNRFQAGVDSAPWVFPLEVGVQNITGLPTTESSAIVNHPAPKINRQKKNRLQPRGIALMIGGGTLIACAAVLSALRINQARRQKVNSPESCDGSLHSLPISTIGDYCSTPREELGQVLTVSSPIHVPRPITPVCNSHTEKTSRRKSFTKNCRVPKSLKDYTIADLQLATDSFSKENFLGEGSLGSVYKAEFPDGKVMVVKNINMVSLSFNEEEQFMDVIRSVSQIRHPNIVKLLGYCVEDEQHLLVYEYVRNLSVDDALHSEKYEPLSWFIRLRIALGVARALDYLHFTFSPPIAHCNVKAANILINEEFIPHLCDCGLAVLRPLTSNKVKVKASEIAIGDTGYIAPEHGQPGIDNRKSDIYAYGVLLLELLTGRLPFDSSRPRKEQSLVKWASSRLHDKESLDQMVDPRIKGTVSSKALSQFADIVCVCIQPEKEFRSPMSEIVQSVICLLKKPITVRSGAAEYSTDMEPFRKSFRSANTRFMGSPAMSFSSM